MIAAIASCVFIQWTTRHDVAERAYDTFVDTIERTLAFHPWTASIGFAIGRALPLTLFTLGVYGLLTALFGPAHKRETETRCRKCRYILRGLREPRCPECGERI